MSAPAVLRGDGDTALARAWLALAACALALAAGLAVAMLAVRWIAPGGDLFPRLLAVHVNVALYVWVPAMGMGLALACRPGAGGTPGWGGFGLIAAGMLGLVAAGLAAPGPVHLVNYVPIVDSPAFHGALGWLAGGWVLSAVALAARWRTGGGAARAAVAAMLVALAVLAWVAAALPPGLSRVPLLETLFWGFGHVWQFAAVGWMVLAWRIARGEEEGGRGGRLPEALLLLPLAAVPVILVSWPVATMAHRQAFTQLMTWGGWLAPTAFLLARLTSPAASGSEAAGWRGSALLFMTGIGLGVAIRGDSTTVPAHYHAMLGALTVALVVATPRALALVGRTAPPRGVLTVRWLAAGIVALVAGLASMGLEGAPRKASVFLFDGTSLLWRTGAVAVCLGGAVALCAIAVHCMQTLRALRTRSVLPPPPEVMRQVPQALTAARRRRDIRVPALAATLAAIGVGGVALQAGSGEGMRRVLSQARAPVVDAAIDARAHVLQRQGAEFDLRFQQAVIMLHARQYEHAMTALHRLLEMRADMPELHVNMGYALLGLGRLDAARDFFESALALRPQQANAYYGLAMAHESAGRLPEALGAMRSYVHLAGADERHVARARAAIWEWESRAARPPAH